MSIIQRSLDTLLLLLSLLTIVTYCQVCPELSAPTNGNITLSDGTNDGSRATYACNEGYELSSASPRFCRGSSMAWTGAESTCDPVDCGSLSSPPNGMVNVPITTFGSIANYSCNSGFALDGNQMRECLADRLWSGNMPTCIVDCGRLDNPPNGIVVISATTEGDTATYFCNEGHVFAENGTNQRTCGSDGRWSGDQPSCTVVDCGELLDPPNGVITLTVGSTFGSEASYSCDEGYMLSGCPMRSCQANGNWSNFEPQCIISDCGSLNDPPNGVVELNHTTFRSVATYICNEGFVTAGNISQQICQANGRWSDEPFCVGLECVSLSPPENGTIILGPRTVGSLAVYICNVGYALSVAQPAYRQCQVNGSWSGYEPTCDPVDCGSLTDIPNGFVNMNGTTIGSTATYRCIEGFSIQGSSERVCEATGQWSEDEPTCETLCSEECDMYARCMEVGEGETTCVCLDGFEGNGVNCTDIDECISNPCHSNAVCDNTLGSYFCTCSSGFEGDGINSCTNINECITIGCDMNAICADTPGSFDCSCNEGFAGDGFTCLDINECERDGSCAENAVCTNTPGSFVCTCDEGYFGDGFSTCAERCSFNLQILFEQIDYCDTWRFVDTATKLSQITGSLRQQIRQRCTTRDACMPQFEQSLRVVVQEFSCDLKNRPIYRASLLAEATESCDEIHSILSEWIMNGTASVVVQGNRLSIADFCEVIFDSFTNPIICNEPTTKPVRTDRPMTVLPSGPSLTAQQAFGTAGGIAGLIVLVVIIASILLIAVVLAAVWKRKKKSHSHYFEHDLTSPDRGDTVINNRTTTIESSPLRPTYSDFNSPDSAIATDTRMSTFNPQSDVIPTLIRSYSSNSLSRNRIHTTVMENQGARELMDDEEDYTKPSTPSP